MPSTLTTTVTELPESRVRVQVQGAARGARAARRGQGARAGRQAEAARLSPRQGARAAGDPARRARGGARGSGARHALQLVCGRAGGHRDRARRRPRRGPRRAASARGEPRVLLRDRRAPARHARGVPGPGGRPRRAGGAGGADPARARRAARAPWAPGDGAAGRRRGRLHRDRLHRRARGGVGRPRSRSPAAKGATSSWSWGRAI